MAAGSPERWLTPKIKADVAMLGLEEDKAWCYCSQKDKASIVVIDVDWKRPKNSSEKLLATFGLR